MKCYSLTEINVSPENTHYSSLDGVLYNKDQTELILCPAGKRGSVTIPAGVIYIEGYAFSYCSSLISVTIPDSVTEIAFDAFHCCYSLSEINVSLENASYSSLDGVLYNKDQTDLIQCPENKFGSFTVPDSVIYISGNAFRNCSNLERITISNSVTYIGGGAFNGCLWLTSITIPENVTEIGLYTFNGCTHLTSVSIGAGVTVIEEAAFSGCKSLTDVYYAGTQEQWNAVSIEANNECLTDATIHYNSEQQAPHTHDTELRNAKSATCTEAGYTGDEVCTTCGETVKAGAEIAALGHSYEDGVCTVCGATDPDATIDSSESYTDPYGITYTLENGTLTVSGEGECSSAWMEQLDQSAVTEIVVKDGVTSIDDYAFAYCASLTSVTIPDSVTNIGMAVFWDSSALTDITLGSEVTSIGADILMGTAYLDNEENWENGALYVDGCLIRASQALSGDYSIKEGTHAIADSAFSFGNTVTSIVIPDGVTRIGEGVFNGCGELASITIPVSVTSISDKAFSFCTKLADIYYGGSEAQWNAIKIERTTGNDGISWDQFFTAATKHFAVEEPAGTFTDVAETAYYATPVAWAVANNITGGYNDNTFRPMNVCTRAQIVTFLWRANGSPEPQGTSQGFNDVFEGTYYYKAVLWAAEQGITGGFNDGGFHPDEFVTRAQAMTFLWRANGKPAVPEGTVNTFTDVPETAYYHDAVLWAVANGVTGGYDASTFGSMDGCTRAQIVTFLYRDMAQ